MVANIVLNWKLLDGVGPQEMSAEVNTLTGNQSDTTYQDGIESHFVDEILFGIFKVYSSCNDTYCSNRQKQINEYMKILFYLYVHVVRY